MDHKKDAELMIEENIEIIREKLNEKGIMFYDGFGYAVSPCVARLMPEIIERRFGLDEDTVYALEFDTGNGFEGIFFLKSLDLSISFIKELTIQHYTRK